MCSMKSAGLWILKGSLNVLFRRVFHAVWDVCGTNEKETFDHPSKDCFGAKPGFHDFGCFRLIGFVQDSQLPICFTLRSRNSFGKIN